jgi:hypothetical protein
MRYLIEKWAERFGIQLVWWDGLWFEITPSNGGSFPINGKHRGCIYRWRFRILGLEIRKWA